MRPRVRCRWPAETVDVVFSIACVPDTGQLAFVAGVAPAIRHVFVINANGTGARRLTNATSSNDEDPAWSPDGKKIVFTTDRDGNREIYVVDADGSNALRLTKDTAADYEPAWSPDGRKIAFSALNCDFYYIQCMPSSVRIGRVGSAKVITLTSGSSPAWRP